MSSMGGKLIRLVIVFLCVTFFSFMLVNLLPGDPVTNFNVGADEAQLDVIREDLQLDDPIPVRYARWLGDFVTGDFGSYYGVAGESPSQTARQAFPRSLQLMVYVQIVALLMAVPLGVLTAYKADSLFDKLNNLFMFAALSVPAYVLAYLLIKVFAIDRSVLPVSGWESIADVGIVEHLKYAVLPVLALAMSQVAVYQRLLRSDMIATLQEDFITMAKAKGLKPRRILFRHALRPSSLTLLTVVGLNVGALIGGSVIIERIFGIPGIGFALVEAYLTREYVAFQSFVALIALVYVLINFIVDFLYTVLDPRIRNA